ncbi:Cysteine desulfuration protein sufE [uncultured Roseburia sp.]|uniref:SufE family protein n=1 Tax=Brotonthovivens ammoniilytica TaxID=2981725 RepID=A0ABT2TML6_9FIRM|nr:SufE family protein [Brotonthovivens ammoniilytica]MCU6763464.1 SufE family protein [Brotonthovivens ammoniilytica]SCJ20204.1 Cysteine desulfuration protein sufE [uncultured Roseburia sp.]
MSTAMAEEKKVRTIAEEEQEFIQEFNELEDWLIQYQALLELTSDMEKLYETERTEENRIHSCQAKLWLVLGYENGKISVRADSESLIVKGIVGVITALFHHRTPEEVRRADITFMDKTDIARQISTDRYKGMQLIIRKIKKFADSCE